MPVIHNTVPKSEDFLVNIVKNLDEDRFKQIVRISWKNFHFILDLIASDPVFNGPRSCKQFAVEKQLIIVLYRLGSSGEGATVAKVASLFGISDGVTLQVITGRVFDAILRLKDKYLYWPSAVERREIVTDTFDELPHCVGYVDGTEIKLAEKPTVDPVSYFSRKHMYSLKLQAICDHKLRIRHLVLGYPGSVHDAKIFNNSSISKNPEEYFSGAEWLAGDSAYKLTSNVLTPFRLNSSDATCTKRGSLTHDLVGIVSELSTVFHYSKKDSTV